MKNPHNIYIHVPFCVQKCKYCAFFSHACANPDWDNFANTIVAEITYWAQKLGKIDIPTIFFGGGTPSMMPCHIFAQIVESLHKNFNILPDAEITIEANPGTIDNARLCEFINIGVNRVSIGVQSFDDARLKFLGRIHSADDARRLLGAALESGIRVSADFIYGLPDDTTDYVKKLCTDINNIGIKHCSMYELTIEENTPFGKMNLQMPTSEQMADMYIAIQETLNLPRYEVSNYAAHGQECRHNQNIWDGAPYIGIGNGAAGRIFMGDVWFEELGGGAKFEQMSLRERAIERVITGMRTMRGVLVDGDVKKILNIEFAKSNPNMLRFDGNRLSATDNGILVLDDLITKLVE